MALQIGKDVFGIAKQTGKGVIATNPAFAFGLAGGGISVDPTQEPDELTSAFLSPAGAYRSKIESGAKVETRAWQKSIGLLLLGALGSVSTTGAGPYTHVVTLGPTLLYFTVFEMKGDGSLHAIKDCKIDEIDISWTENVPLAVSVTFVGCKWSVPVTFVPTTDESDTTAYFTPVGGTFKYDVDSAVPAAASVLGGKINIKRTAEAKFFSGTIEPGDVSEGACAVETALTVMPDDMTLWRNVLTGAVGGTQIQSEPLYGSFEYTFAKGADSLKLAGANTAFLCAMPEADPKGGAAELELAGIAYRAAGTPLTATLVNTQASY